MCLVGRDIIHHPFILPLVVLKHSLLGLLLFMVVLVGFPELVFEPSIGVPFKSIGLLI